MKFTAIVKIDIEANSAKEANAVVAKIVHHLKMSRDPGLPETYFNPRSEEVKE